MRQMYPEHRKGFSDRRADITGRNEEEIPMNSQNFLSGIEKRAQEPKLYAKICRSIS
jgi:hypothetical protein